jgi:hypothetical protein
VVIWTVAKNAIWTELIWTVAKNAIWTVAILTRAAHLEGGQKCHLDGCHLDDDLK